MLIIALIVAYFVVRLVDKLNRLNLNERKQNITHNETITIKNYYVPIYDKVHSVRLKRKILTVVYDATIPALEKPDILVRLMIELHKYEDTSDFIDSFPEIHSKIFGGITI